MQVADVISQDRETKLLAGFGIEGEHFAIPEGETAPQLLPAINALSTADRTDQFGFGFYWDGTFSTYSFQSSAIQRLIEEHVMDPDGTYGANKLDLCARGPRAACPAARGQGHVPSGRVVSGARRMVKAQAPGACRIGRVSGTSDGLRTVGGAWAKKRRRGRRSWGR